MRRAAVSFSLLLAGSGAALSCEPPAIAGGIRIEGARHVVVFRPAPAPTPLNAPFAVDFAICAKDGSGIGAPRIDAWMPAHRHGMNYRPSMAAIEPGRFRAEGLLFHMPGRWEFLFEVGGERITATQDLK